MYNIQQRIGDRYVAGINPISLSKSQAIGWKTRHSAESAHQQISRIYGNAFRVVERSKPAHPLMLIGAGFMVSFCVGFVGQTLRAKSAVAPIPPIVTIPEPVPTPVIAPSTLVPMVNKSDPDTLKMVMVDQALLTEAQRNQLEQLATQLPPTSVGKSCQYYGKPDVWCLILKPETADQVFQQLYQFRKAASIQPVKLFGEGISKDHPG